MAKRKNFIKVLATLGVSALVAGAGVSTLSAGATAEKTVAGKGVDSFQMVYGASVRCGDGVENGIRFSATISDDEYKTLEKLEETSGVSVNYGVLIVPADLFNETNLTEENIFQNQQYCLEGCESGCSKTHLATVEYEKLANDSSTDGRMNLRGSLIQIQSDNINREFVGLAYIEYNTATTSEYEFANYALPVDENNNPIEEGTRELANTTRSMTYVAQRAIVKNEVDATTAQTLETDYIAPLANNNYKYFVRHHLSANTVVEETCYGKLNSAVTAQHIAKTNPTEYSHYATYGASSDSNTSDIVYANGRTVLNYYYVARDTVLFDGDNPTDFANLKVAFDKSSSVGVLSNDTDTTTEEIDAISYKDKNGVEKSGLTKIVLDGENETYGSGYLKMALADEKIDDANSANWDYLTVTMCVTTTADMTSFAMYSKNRALGSVNINEWVDFVIPKSALNTSNSYLGQNFVTKDKFETAFDNWYALSMQDNQKNYTHNLFYTNSLKKTQTGTNVTYYIEKITWGIDVTAPEISIENNATVYAEGVINPSVIVSDDYNVAPVVSKKVFSVATDDTRTEISAQTDGTWNLSAGKYVLVVEASDGPVSDIVGNVAVDEVAFEVRALNDLLTFESASEKDFLIATTEQGVTPTISWVESHGEGENERDGVLVYQSSSAGTNNWGGYFYLNLSDQMINQIWEAYNDESVDFTLTIDMWVEISEYSNTVNGVSLYGGSAYSHSWNSSEIGYFTGEQWTEYTFNEEQLAGIFGWAKADTLATTSNFYKKLNGGVYLFYLGHPTLKNNTATTITYYIDSISFSTSIAE